jgi:hypothetical protein
MVVDVVLDAGQGDEYACPAHWGQAYSFSENRR